MRRALLLVVACLCATAGLAAAQEPLPVPVPAANLIIGKTAPLEVPVKRGQSVQARVTLTKSAMARVTRTGKLRATLRLVLVGSETQTKTVTLKR